MNAKKARWSSDTDEALIKLREEEGMRWDDIKTHFPGRSALSCRLRYYTFHRPQSQLDEEVKNNLARYYEEYVRIIYWL